MKKQITVLIADDHAVVREGFRLLLETEKTIKVIAEARDGRVAVELAKKYNPDVLILDIAMPLLNGFEATRQILKDNPKAKILILSAYSDLEYVERVIKLGASGYLLKQSSSQDLSKAIIEVSKGKIFYGPAISKRLAVQNKKFLGRDGTLRNKSIQLSSRESEVLQLIAEGKANKEIASELNISIKTVEKHRQHLMEKLNIHDTAGLTRYAISSGVIENSSQSTTQL